jgi:hypothetical protein
MKAKNPVHHYVIASDVIGLQPAVLKLILGHNTDGSLGRKAEKAAWSLNSLATYPRAGVSVPL